MMRRTAALSALILTGGLLESEHPLAAGAATTTTGGSPSRTTSPSFCPNGTTLTDEGMMEEPEGDPPVGTQLFISEALHEAKDDNEAGDEIGRSHIECTAQVVPGELPL